jgi:hypothetical protein
MFAASTMLLLLLAPPVFPGVLNITDISDLLGISSLPRNPHLFFTLGAGWG